MAGQLGFVLSLVDLPLAAPELCVGDVFAPFLGLPRSAS